MGSVNDLTGRSFGRLVVLSRAGSDKHGSAKWLCLCDCGKEITVLGNNLAKGSTKSCGCLHNDVVAKHNLSGIPAYHSWYNARDRTLNKDNKKWEDYGGRGITMCQEWIDSFEAFWYDMGSTWEEGLTLDRIDVNGNYCKENCRWAWRTHQSHNQRKRKGCSSQYHGVYLNKMSGKFTAKIQFEGKHEHLGCFAREEDAALAHDNRSEELYGDRPNGTSRQ